MFEKLKQKHIIYASLLIGIFSLFMFCTIAYSAINGTVKISGNAYARVEADVRITDFRLASSNNATSFYEEFGKNHVVTDVEFINSSSSVSYYVEVSNYGTNSVGIYEITGLPSEVSYTIEGYNLKDKICDNSNVCSGFLKQTYKITLNSTSGYTGSIKLDFDFRPFLNITYDGISGNYRKDFIAGDYVNINVGYLDFVYVYGEEDFEYEYDSGNVSFWDAWCDVEIGLVTSNDYSYIGDVQTYKVKADGIYRVELWGASSGYSSLLTPGRGGYTSGYTYLNKDDVLYFYVGQKGCSQSSASDPMSASYNGGIAGKAHTSGLMMCGGGATDVRLVGGAWNNFDSLKSRIMVAGGGGGGVDYSTFTYKDNKSYVGGSSAGGLIGYNGRNCDTREYYKSSDTKPNSHPESSGGGQTNGGISIYKGSFGYGGTVGGGAPGAGGGYYGGESGYDTGWFTSAGGGGSSFISWHDGCDAVTESSTSSNIIHTGQSIHYSGYVFTNTTMIDGDGYKWTDAKGNGVVGMPKTDYSGVMTGNTENGYAKITPISMGEHHLVKYKYNDENLSNYSFVKNGEDLNVSFVDEYYSVLVKNKAGSVHSNYSYDRVNKYLVVNDVTDDIEITLVRPFDVDVSFEVGGDECIHNYFSFQNIHNEHFPITIDYYHKESYEDEYSLVETIEFASEDDFGNWFYDCDTIAYANYDVRIEFKANNGYVTSVEANVDTECFVAGTKVLVENGYKNIEDIQVGDYVYALDLDTNEKSLKQVTRKFEGFSNETYEIVVNGEKITATPKHEFYVIDKGWIRAYDLEVGDVLNSFNNGHLEITDIKYVMHGNPVKVYNLTVDGLHNYLISSDQLLVHNSMSFQ